jgi:glutamate-ammonia-ligase adenylyltransferase
MTSDTQWQSELDGLIDSRLRSLGELDDLAFHAAMAHPLGCHLPALLAVSDYAFEQLRRHPDWLVALGDAPAPPDLRAGEEARWPDQLRVWRHRRSIDLILRDVAGIDRVQDTLRGSSEQAELCCQWALDALYAGMVDRHGVPRSASGQAQQLVVFGLGKLGGGELNFSSDIDLVFAYPEQGETDGARPIDNETFFVRLGQQFIKLLGDTTAEGFGFRVDMRLRPFGTVGRLALSFNAMEQYFQREGRDWERYAWIKARPIAGDIAAGERFLGTLRPFVYRRYFDYTAFEGLREMKAMIEAEVQRRELADHLKLGPGGIREIEFMVQLQQLIRGGREPELRQRGLLPALAALCRRRDTWTAPACGGLAGGVSAIAAQRESPADAGARPRCTVFPEAAFERYRLARGLGYANYAALVRGAGSAARFRPDCIRTGVRVRTTRRAQR